MKILIAPDKFKGTLLAQEAAEAIGRGLLAANPEAQLDFAPVADGGEGFAAAIAGNSQRITLQACDPLRRPVEAHYFFNPERRLAIMEMSHCSGLWRLRPDERRPDLADTFGTGQLMAHAAAAGARKIIIGLGGSATTDGGAGMAEALGWKFLDSQRRPLKACPRHFELIEHIEGCTDLPTIIGACDVTNPLLGTHGTAAVYSPQKGASPEMMRDLERWLERLAEVVARDLGCDFRNHPGAGAAGGLGFGLLSFCQAQLRPGFDLVAEALNLEERIRAADLVITGEGRLDAQSMSGKAPVRVAALARRHGKPVVAFVGQTDAPPNLLQCFDAVHAISNDAISTAQAMKESALLLEVTARNSFSAP